MNIEKIKQALLECGLDLVEFELGRGQGDRSPTCINLHCIVAEIYHDKLENK